MSRESLKIITIKKYKKVTQQKCEVCEWTPPDGVRKEILHVHHIIPFCHGGTEEDYNLILLCPNCHSIAHVVCSGRMRKDIISLIGVAKTKDEVKLAIRNPVWWIELTNRRMIDSISLM